MLLAQIFKAKVIIGLFGHAAAARRACQKTLLQKVRLVNILQRHGFLIDGRRKRIKADGAAAVKFDDAAEHPAVEEVTVIGIPDAYRGEAPKAFVKLKEGVKATQAELIEFLRPRLSKIELPAEIEFRDELPKTLVGKHSKKELRAERAAKSRSA